MQFNQPVFGNDYQRISYHSYRPNSPPEVVGEGDIISTVLPDGTVHFFFVPVYKHAPYSSVHYKFNINDNHFQWRTGPEVWLIRSIPNPAPLTSFNNAPQNVFKDHFLPPPYYESNCHISIPNTGYVQKFHNDNTTSTSDICYFYPSLRPPKEKPKTCAAVQVVSPNENIRTVCCKYCNKNVNEVKAECMCHTNECLCRKLQSSDSDMSIDDTFRKPRKRKYHRKGKRRSRKENICNCEQTSTSDKFVTTYADQSSNCTPRDGRETQTTLHSCLKNDRRTADGTPSHKRVPHIEILAPNQEPSYRIPSSNTSNMSGQETNQPRKKKGDKKIKTKLKNYIGNISKRKSNTSNKLVTTYTDQSSACVARDGRETQTATQKTKKSDIQTEVWVPLRKRQPHIKILTPGNSSCSDSCTMESRE